MLDEALTALAASGGAAVTAAAGTDAWTGLRAGLARWFGRGSEQREAAVLHRLDQTGAELAEVEPAQAEPLRSAYRAIWQTRIQDLLEDLDDDAERARAASALRELLARLPAAHAQVAADHGAVAVGGDLTVRSDGGSVAAAVIRGDVHLGRPEPAVPAEGPDLPSPPDAPQG
ncbi:hypothetical protein [Actinacidiphila paucisporea]|uniref:Uncharacterized protein n=1 Tax=Actinacidiphila paucisporea TaxID=310782 RepID=A0A1M7HZC3_9ACTN|nr:hypothetical protein [Actinacidiphila paucisporea]SHM33896.1 hypothetical protein SAMN05216499_11097 [Actinacidiphila paucisporea]